MENEPPPELLRWDCALVGHICDFPQRHQRHRVDCDSVADLHDLHHSVPVGHSSAWARVRREVQGVSKAIFHVRRVLDFNCVIKLQKHWISPLQVRDVAINPDSDVDLLGGAASAQVHPLLRVPALRLVQNHQARVALRPELAIAYSLVFIPTAYIAEGWQHLRCHVGRDGRHQWVRHQEDSSPSQPLESTARGDPLRLISSNYYYLVISFAMPLGIIIECFKCSVKWEKWIGAKSNRHWRQQRCSTHASHHHRPPHDAWDHQLCI